MKPLIAMLAFILLIKVSLATEITANLSSNPADFITPQSPLTKINPALVRALDGHHFCYAKILSHWNYLEHQGLARTRDKLNLENNIGGVGGCQGKTWGWHLAIYQSYADLPLHQHQKKAVNLLSAKQVGGGVDYRLYLKNNRLALYGSLVMHNTTTELHFRRDELSELVAEEQDYIPSLKLEANYWFDSRFGVSLAISEALDQSLIIDRQIALGIVLYSRLLR